MSIVACPRTGASPEPAQERRVIHITTTGQRWLAVYHAAIAVGFSDHTAQRQAFAAIGATLEPEAA